MKLHKSTTIIGTKGSPVNSNFSISNILKEIISKTDYIKDFDKNDRFNTRESVKKAVTIIRYNQSEFSDMKTQYGLIEKISCGYSKIAIIFNLNGFKYCLKVEYDTELPQLMSQVKRYESLKDSDIGQYLLPTLKSWDRLVASLEPYCEYVGNLSDCLNYIGQQYNYSSIEKLILKYRIRDVLDNSSNVGVWNNNIYILDYAL